MARACTVCNLPEAGTINALLRDGRSARAVAAELGLSYDALTRHARNHASRPLVVRSVATEPSADPLAELVTALRVRALAGSDAASREYRLALLARENARHAAAPIRDLASEPEWIELRARLLRLLEPFPDARLALAEGLEL